MKYLVLLTLLWGAAAQAETVFVSDEEANVVHVVDGETLRETGASTSAAFRAAWRCRRIAAASMSR
jgi:hypothetical protein